MTDKEFSERLQKKLEAKLMPPTQGASGAAADGGLSSLILLLIPLLQDVVASLMDRCRAKSAATVESAMANPDFATRFAIRREIRSLAPSHGIPEASIAKAQNAAVSSLVELGQEATPGERAQIINARNIIPDYTLV